MQTGIIAQVTSPTLTHIKSSKDNKSIKGVFGAGNPGVAVLGQGRLTQSQPARSQPPCLVPSRLIPTINKHIVLVHVNRLHSGGELSLRGALLHLGIDSVPSTYISGLTLLARPEQIPPESTERNTIFKTRSILDVMRAVSYTHLTLPTT